MIGQLIAAIIGTVAFCALFSVPRKYYLFCGITGGLGWMVYLLAGRVFGYGVSILFAAAVVAFTARIMTVCLSCPSPVFLIPGLFPLVPGAGVYWTTYYTVVGDLQMAGQAGYDALKCAVAIVLAIVFIYELPQAMFTKPLLAFKGIIRSRKES